MSLKLSRYNLFIEEGGYIIYNTLARSLVYMDKQMAEALRALSFHSIPAEYLEKLKANNVLVDERYDELQIVKSVYWTSKLQGDKLGIVILPTYQCNLACNYCSQGKNKLPFTMDLDTAASVCEWLIKHMQGGNFKHLSLLFYGGEPLLNLEVVLNLSNRMKRYCDENSLGFNISVITNGVLLSRSVVKKLLDVNLTSVQVTLDGPPNIHNSRRPTKDGKGTFGVIYNNVQEFLALAPNSKLTIRINLDRENLSYVASLIELLERDKISELVSIDIGKVDITDLNIDYEKRVLSSRTMGRSFINLLTACGAGLLKNSYLENVNPTFCGLATANAFTIDPRGKVFKCLELLNEETFCLGDVKKGISPFKHLWWLSANPFEDSKCRRCLFLPLCGGGCTAQAYFLYGDIYKRVCPWQSYTIEAVIKQRVKMLYHDKISRKQNFCSDSE